MHDRKSEKFKKRCSRAQKVKYLAQMCEVHLQYENSTTVHLQYENSTTVHLQYGNSTTKWRFNTLF